MKILKLISLLFLLLTTQYSSIHSQTQIGSDVGDQSSILSSVALSGNGNRIVVGTPILAGNNVKDISVYEFENNNWVPQGTSIIIESPYLFSPSVVLSANGIRLAVGIPWFEDKGLVRVYEYDGNDWMQLGSDFVGVDNFSSLGTVLDLSIDGNRLFLNDDTNSTIGKVRAFEYDGNDWVQIGADINGLGENDGFGSIISCNANGNRVAVLAAGSLDNPDNLYGEIRVFQLENDSWTLMDGTIVAEALFDMENLQLSHEGNTLVVAKGFSPEALEVEGFVRAFEYTGNSWEQKGTGIVGEPNALFGYSLGISGDGDRIVVGAPSHPTVEYENMAVYAYEFNGQNWASLGVIEAGGSDEILGNSVSISENGSFIATNFDRIGGGTVRVYGNLILSAEEIIAAEVIDLEVFPNPTKDVITITSDIPAFGSIELLDARGKLVTSLNANAKEFDLSQFPTGVYFLSIQTEKGLVIEKILKK